MIYDILALLWDRPQDLDALVESMTLRTGKPVASYVLDGYLWFLFQFGFVDASAGERTHHPMYALTPRGSELLALTAQEYQHVSL